jgi:hypothetical protein
MVDMGLDGREAIVLLASEKGTQLVAVALEGSSDPRPLGSWQNGSQLAAFFSRRQVARPDVE